MKRGLRHSLLGSLAFGAASAAIAAVPACTAHSPEHRVALLELYTSEGCSSCPPADRWLSAARQRADWGGRVVPLALHVDYWDYIGWKDAYAKPLFSARQQEQVAAAGNTVVYTPQFFVQGRSWRSARPSSNLDAALQEAARKPAGADVSLTSQKTEGRSLPVRLEVRLKPGQDAAAVYVALYQNGLTTSVRAGENQGATLRHDYVVREWIGPKILAPGQVLSETVRLALPDGAAASDLGVAAFVQNPRSRDVLQALSLPLCASPS